MTKEQKLNKQVEDQQETISRLSGRVSELSDRIHLLENGVEDFKTKVSRDMQVVVGGVTKLSEFVKKDKTF